MLLEKVSVVITTHNRVALLEKAVDSVLKQTYSNIELIIVDDASTDGTKKVCSNLIKKYPEIGYIYIPKEESKGGNYARNLGISYASGCYIAFLDDDDEWLSTKIAKQVSIISKDEKIGLVYSGVICRNIYTNYSYDTLWLPCAENAGDLSRKILMGVVCITSSILVRKVTLEECGRFDEKLRCWQEYELLIRICQSCKIGFVSEPLVIYSSSFVDKERLTNNLSSFLESTVYIEHKHAILFSNLSKLEKDTYLFNKYRDAAVRCETLNSKRLLFSYLKRIYFVRKGWKNLIRLILIIGPKKEEYLLHKYLRHG